MVQIVQWFYLHYKYVQHRHYYESWWFLWNKHIKAFRSFQIHRLTSNTDTYPVAKINCLQKAYFMITGRTKSTCSQTLICYEYVCMENPTRKIRYQTSASQTTPPAHLHTIGLIQAQQERNSEQQWQAMHKFHLTALTSHSQQELK